MNHQYLLLTGYDDAMACVGDLTTPAMKDYARRWSMDFHCLRQFHPNTSANWQTGEAVVQSLQSYSCVIWLGADVVITNPQFDVRPFLDTPGFHASRDWGHTMRNEDFSTGAYACTRESLPLWHDALARKDVWACRPLWEQSALIESCGQHFHLASLVHIYPRRFWNAVPPQLHSIIPEPWQPGDWLCHLTGVPNATRLRYIQERLPHLISA